ncbi:hypothetical protein ACMHYB_45135 [Sorangium sp. So ce1128]
MKLFAPDRSQHSIDVLGADDGSVLEWVLRLTGCVDFMYPPPANDVRQAQGHAVDLVYLPRHSGGSRGSFALRFAAPGKAPEFRRLDFGTGGDPTGPVIIVGERRPYMPAGFPEPEARHLEARRRCGGRRRALGRRRRRGPPGRARGRRR